MQQDPSTQSAPGKQQSVSAVHVPPMIQQQVSFSQVTPGDEQQSWKELHPNEPRGMQQEPPTQSAAGAQQSVSAAHAPPFNAQHRSLWHVTPRDVQQSSGKVHPSEPSGRQHSP